MYDLIVVGGGPAGLAAACAAWDGGLRRILIVERDRELGGILNQCIHNGFGLHYFKEELTGPEYAGRFVKLLGETGVEVRLDTMVLEVTPERRVHMVGKAAGYRVEEARSVILAMGCRERTRGAIAIPGTRPAGVYTAGAAQRYVNMEGRMPGRRVVILGSGDIGLIMARRMTLEGAQVLACVELMPYSGGLNRNIVQCLHDYGIPLYLSHTVTEIRGRDRLEQVAVARVDKGRNPIPGTEMVFDCDTLLLSVGLVPENELTRQAGIEIDPRTGGAVVCENMETSLRGVFACGNVAHVHDLVDFVTAESQRAGRAAARYVLDAGAAEGPVLTVRGGDGVTYTVPQRIRPAGVERAAELFFRVNRVCGGSEVLVTSGESQIARFPREHLAPGEMEHIILPRVLLDRAEEEITVSIREVAAT
ncbi:FAD-dependent oxidoreductase [Pseudoflavonifractor sp. BIOML-A6]|nr:MULTISPECIES: FAD-dependent oxidoreductase [unclassified Pseudoflavonifractor]MTQ97049.1 FAD-dependent oxidoreductase [Pseudoflavonifractor sp. BIOML-A16]MTR06129.1 FAD-dependent oxidoreductase [Pseudoflavonifractor sp. BIOML-A15]MTR33680.1 FAD-dependent oxidoreductase [Pseudoflavonifractor sp. BIOML-A14]MTR72821.1 FAD-dependent oxidoreductase [Pseudoflavonifractor sp. BIOML-A18]MTS63278.1 FAD-dependent oxidoreductase [Pseudoflavonifractor sp. BIOML-A5]MTS70913.1 FAD-dependent oxidoreducta